MFVKRQRCVHDVRLGPHGGEEWCWLVGFMYVCMYGWGLGWCWWVGLVLVLVDWIGRGNGEGLMMVVYGWVYEIHVLSAGDV